MRRALLLLSMICGAGLCHGSCIFLRDDRSIRCRNTTLPDIAESLHILTRVVLNRPEAVDIEGGVAQFLPPLFQDLPINTTIKSVRVVGAGLRAVHDDAFLPLAQSLTYLDLSRNAFLQPPRALVPLVNLISLDLSRNRIRFLRPEDGVLERLPNLKELDLSHNLIGLARDGLQIRGPLSVDDFNISPRSLASLSLRGNRLSGLPGQLSGQRGVALPDLTHLDLSGNAIGRIDGLRESAPALQELNLRANQVKRLAKGLLPDSLQLLNLSENPFTCDCNAFWLFEWMSGNGTVLRSPICHAPDHLKNTPFDQVQWSLECSDKNDTLLQTTLGPSQSEKDGADLTAGTTTISVRWAVPEGAWAVVYRPSSDSPHQMRLAAPGSRAQIVGLRPATPYIVCLARGVPGGKYTLEPDKCRKIITRAETLDVKTELEDIVLSTDSIEVSWKLNWLQDEIPEDMSVRHEWTIRIRRSGSDNFTDIPVYDITASGDTEGQVYDYRIPDLSPRTYYDVCLVDVEHRPLEAPEAPDDDRPRPDTIICRTVQTYGHYGPEIAGITLACLFSVASVLLVIYLARRKRILPHKIRRWFDRCKDRPRPVGCSSLYASSRLDAANFDATLRSHLNSNRHFISSPFSNPNQFNPSISSPFRNQSHLSPFSNHQNPSGVTNPVFTTDASKDGQLYTNNQNHSYDGSNSDHPIIRSRSTGNHSHVPNQTQTNNTSENGNIINRSHLHPGDPETVSRSHLNTSNEISTDTISGSHYASIRNGTETANRSNLHTLSRSHLDVSKQGCSDTPNRRGDSNGHGHFRTAPRIRPDQHSFARSFVESWNTLRLPDFSGIESRPEFRSFRTTGYRDALSSVTIYSSGYSEC